MPEPKYVPMVGRISESLEAGDEILVQFTLDLDGQILYPTVATRPYGARTWSPPRPLEVRP